MPALHLINHLLQCHPDTRRELCGFTGIVIGVRGSSLQFSGTIGADGLLHPARRRPDTVLILHPDALSAILNGRFPDWNDIAWEGDIEMGLNLMYRFTRLRYHPQRDLTRLLGQENALSLLNQAAQLGGKLQIIGKLLAACAPHTGSKNW